MKSALLCLLLLTATAVSFAQEKKTPRTDRGSTAPAATPVPARAVQAPAPAPAPMVTISASSPINDDLPTQMAADFFASLKKGQIDDAYATLTKGSKTIEKPEDLRILKQKTKEAIEVFGAIIGYELVETKRIGTHLMRRTYLSLGDEFPLRWRFYFYEAGGRWRLIDLRVDDRLTGMFDEPKDASEDAKGDK